MPSFFERAPEEGPTGGVIRPGRYELDVVEVYLPPDQSADVPAARIVWELTVGEARQSSDSTDGQGATVLDYYLADVTTNGPLVTMAVTCSSVEGAAGTSTQFSYTATEDAFTTFIGDYSASEPRIVRRYLRR